MARICGLHRGEASSSVASFRAPQINATAAMILGVTLSSIVAVYVVLRRTSQGREATAMPGV
jgi:branched-subunit amino acid ABC-type transport system permease component